ncbi:hypothetical protein [Enterovirga aerilata]|uniref:Uncharacterized protein n=1 Tax=Enterovirga aerilata TaxID=2730920 RepID=A0A849I511_9HYPH|nr:hypothetical protein [Enterovirga sp. DB1703]NNM71425.1 hypothetical protein [Enterovirga sp. DB1703]
MPDPRRRAPVQAPTPDPTADPDRFGRDIASFTVTAIQRIPIVAKDAQAQLAAINERAERAMRTAADHRRQVLGLSEDERDIWLAQARVGFSAGLDAERAFLVDGSHDAPGRRQ